MLKLTQLDGTPVFFKADAIGALVPTPTGCRVFGGGVNAEVRESAMKVATLIKNAEKRATRNPVPLRAIA